MTILFLARRFYPDTGGVEKHVFLLSKQLLKKNHTVIVIAEKSNQTSDKKRQFVEGIEVHKIDPGENNWFKKFRIWQQMWNLRKIIANTDIVHSHDVFFWYLPFRFLWPKKSVFMTFHGYENFPISKKAIIIRKLSEKLSWGNICIGDFIKKWYGTKPTFVSYGAVEIPKEIIRPVKKDSALFYGRLDDQTGILTYVETVEKLKKYYPKFKFLVVGDGEYANVIKNKASVTGFQENPERLFNTYNFAFVSRYLSILEAMAAKRLVFAVYDNPIKEDYLKMAPYAKDIIIAGTPEILIDRIRYYLNNPQEEYRLVTNGYQWVKSQSWEQMATLYMQLWNKT